MKALILILAACAGGTHLLADPAVSLPDYAPQQVVSGTITSWGHVFMKPVMERWERGFKAYHPSIQFSDNLVSSAAATGALFTRTADLGLVGREIRPMEVAGYARVMKAKPYPIQVMTGSYANPDKSVALGIFVHKDNPLAQLSYRQLDAIFGAERLRGETTTIRTWDQLGLQGEWRGHKINLYQGLLDAAPAFYFSSEVLKGSLLWNENTRVFDDVDLPGGKTLTAAQQVVNALGKDRYGMALAGVGTEGPDVKLIAIARSDSGPWIAPTRGTVLDRTYPLARSVWIYINRKPGEPIDPKVREFLRYILSKQGQAEVAGEGDYQPLPPTLAAEQAKRLD